MRSVIGNFHDYMNVHKKILIKKLWNGQIIDRVLEINDIRTIHMEMGFPEIKNTTICYRTNGHQFN